MAGKKLATLNKSASTPVPLDPTSATRCGSLGNFQPARPAPNSSAPSSPVLERSSAPSSPVLERSSAPSSPVLERSSAPSSPVLERWDVGCILYCPRAGRLEGPLAASGAGGAEPRSQSRRMGAAGETKSQMLGGFGSTALRCAGATAA